MLSYELMGGTSDSGLLTEAQFQKDLPGLSKILEARANPEYVPVAKTNKGFFVAASDIEKLIESGGMITSVDEALSKIIASNGSQGMTNENTIICMDGSNFYMQDFAECGMLLEVSAEDGATTLSKTIKWYNKFVATSKNGKGDRGELQDRINVLKQCVTDMERAKKNLDGEKVKFVLKDLIPFNGIYRLITKQDAYSGIINISKIIVRTVLSRIPFVGLATNVGSKVAKALTYEKMMDKCIDSTNEAIKFLEKKVNEM